MSIFNRLFGRKAAHTDPEQLLRALMAFIQADTWAESRRVVEQHPELLSDEADELLAQRVELARAQGNEDAVHLLEEHRVLLRRCREVGVARAFAEKMLRPEVLEQAAALGLAPEQVLEAWEVLAELVASGAEIRSPEDLERLLSERPDLRQKLEAAAAFVGPTRPSEPSAEEIRRHPLYPLAERALRGEIPLEEALRQATARETLAALDDAAIDRMDDFIIALSRNPARPTRDRVLAYLLAELNHAAAQALPASPPIRAYTANTLGNTIAEFPFKTPAHLERRVDAYRKALAIWQARGDARRVAMLQNNLGNAYLRLARVREREENLQRAIQAYREALRFYTPRHGPAGVCNDPEQPGQCLQRSGPGAGAGGEPAAGHPGLPGGPASAG